MERLLKLSQRLVASTRVDDPMPVICLAQDSIDETVESTDLSTLSEHVIDPESTSEEISHEHVVWIEACLRNPRGFTASSETKGTVEKLIIWLARIVRPPDLFGWRSSIGPDPTDEIPREAIRQYHLKSVAGLRALLSLFGKGFADYKDLQIDLVTTLACFTDVTDPWTWREAHDLSTELLANFDRAISPPLSTHVPTILQNVVRPAFSKQRQPALAPSGRAAISRPDVEAPFFQNPEAEERPWKFREPWVVTVFLWCIEQVDSSAVNDLWPQLTPPTLALMDDGSVHFKVKGCHALCAIMPKVDAAMLERTGLGNVFEQALVPMLNLLPSLTEENESVRILSESFDTLRRLASTRYRHDEQKRLKSLDVVMRVGVVRGHNFAGDYPRLGMLLADEARKLVDEMGIDAVKHLKTIVPILVDNLCNPFATAAPGLLVASAQALQTIVLTCWPRIPKYAGLILQGIAVCWCRMSDEDAGEKFDETRSDLRKLLALLKATLASDEQALEDLKNVLQSDERLKDLLTV